jgi:raffinose/stachyose/melibiose transport system substrate-binding protein
MIGKVVGLFRGSALGATVLALALILSLVTVFRNNRAAEYPGKKIIRIFHWQLEAGYRSAIDKAITGYEKLHPDVKIIQMAVSDQVYDQLLNVNFVSGTAPDIVELGKGKFGSDDQYAVRFLLPLSSYIREPNPYNKGTPLENVPWQETFIDGMQGGYKWQLQDFYAIAPTLFEIRYFYNKQLYKQITGKASPPQTFGELMDMGAKVRQYSAEHKTYITPMVNWNARFDKNMIGPYQIPFTANLDDLVDTDMDGEITGIEAYASYMRGEWSLKSPYLEAFYNMLHDWSSLFEPGFMGMDRQTAMFRFANQQAVILIAGSWDAKSIAKQSEGHFDVGVFEQPIPAKNEKYGSFVKGRATESNAMGGTAYGVYKGSKYPEIAIDFLKFISSQPYNGPIMEIASWPPIVVGSATSDQMKPFIPDPEGYATRLEINLADYGNPVTVLFNELARFQGSEQSLDEFAAKYDAAVRDPQNGGDYIWAQEYANQRQQARTQERLLSIHALRELEDPTATDAPVKYRKNLIASVRGNVGEVYRYRFEELRKKPIPKL